MATRAASVANVFGIGTLVLGAALGVLIHRMSLPVPPPSDPTERDLAAPYHNVTAGEYTRVKWWHDELGTPITVEGKVALITGGSSGIGRAVAAELCRLGAASVTITSRSLERAKRAAEEMVVDGSCKSEQIDPAAVDLGDLGNVRSFAEDFTSRHDRLHYFVQNAGGMTIPGEGMHQFQYVTQTGHEYSYVGNYLGHFLLLNLLLDVIKKSAPARITATSSIGHWSAITDDLPSILPSGSNAMRSLKANLSLSSFSSAFRQYGNTKFLQVAMCYELQRRLGRDSAITVTPLAPGYINTNIGSGNRDEIAFGNFLARSPMQGAKTTLHALLSPSMEGRTGSFLQPYWSPLHRGRPSWPWGFAFRCIVWELWFQRISWAPHVWLSHPDAHRQKFGRQLWEESLGAVGLSSNID